MPSSHLMLCRPPLLLPPIPPRIRVLKLMSVELLMTSNHRIVHCGEPACQCRRPKRCGFDPWVGKIPGGYPLQYSCLENPRDGRAWWAAVYGVAQSRTRLERLSSSSSSSSRFVIAFLPRLLLVSCSVMPDALQPFGLQHSFPTRDQTPAPCTGSVESLNPQGSPSSTSLAPLARLPTGSSWIFVTEMLKTCQTLPPSALFLRCCSSLPEVSSKGGGCCSPSWPWRNSLPLPRGCFQWMMACQWRLLGSNSWRML